MLALSTSWNAATKTSGKQVIREIKKLGFNCAELGFSHSRREIEQILKNKDINVVSLHNYCPIPERLPKLRALPDAYSLSSPNSSERKKAVKFTKRTISFAAKFKARVVILHCGRVQITDHTKKLFALKSKKAESCEFDSLKELTIKERRDSKDRFLDCIFLSLRELSHFAYNLGISIGIENRIYIREIPNFSEVKIFLDSFSKKGVRYWHDTGHAYLLGKLGFNKHTDYLEAYKNHLIGIHLHDVAGFDDHMAPFCGEIDFEAFKPYIKENTIKVIEAHRPATAQEIVLAKQKIEKLFCS